MPVPTLTCPARHRFPPRPAGRLAGDR